MIAHIVLFKPKTSLTGAERRAFAQAVRETLSTCPGLVRAFVGKAISVDPGYARNLDNGSYPYTAVLEFETDSNLVEYLSSAAHQRLGRLFWDNCEATIVCESETRSPTDEGIIDFLAE